MVIPIEDLPPSCGRLHHHSVATMAGWSIRIDAVDLPPPKTSPGRTVFTSWPLRIMNAAAVLVLSAIPSGILAEVGASQAPAAGTLGTVTLVLGVVFAVRALRMAVTFEADTCTVRNLFRTRRFKLQDVDRFEFDVGLGLGTGDTLHLVTRAGTTTAITVLTLPAFGIFQGPGRRRCAAMNADLNGRR